MTVKQINQLIKSAEKCGKYAFAKVSETIITGNYKRVIACKSIRGEIMVKTLSSGAWVTLVDNSIEIR